MNIDQLVEQYKTVEELKIFAGSQFKQILSLTKKIKELEEQLNKKEAAPKTQIEPSSLGQLNADGNLVGPDLKVLNDAKTIAQVQIRMLRDVSFGRELTLEETKKLDIFNKILTDKEEVKKKDEKPIKAISDNELLTLINGSNG